MYASVLPVFMWTMCLLGVCWGQKRMLDSLELCQCLWSTMEILETKPRYFTRATSVINSQAISLAAPVLVMWKNREHLIFLIVAWIFFNQLQNNRLTHNLPDMLSHLQIPTSTQTYIGGRPWHWSLFVMYISRVKIKENLLVNTPGLQKAYVFVY